MTGAVRWMAGVALVLALVGGGGCDAGSPGPDADSVAHASVSPPAEQAAKGEPDPADAVDPTSAAAPALEPAQDSKIPAHKFVIDDKATAGLVEFAGDLPKGGSLWVGPLEGNGGRDVVVYVPPKPDNAADFRLVYHFHGTYSEHIEPQRPGVPKKRWVGWNRLQQTMEAAGQLQAERPYNVALVYPLSAGKRREPGLTGWWNKAYDRMWMNPADPPGYRDSFDVLHREVRGILTDAFGVHPTRLRAKVIAEGHSAGGIALLNIALVGTKHVDEYIFQDASFQGWGDGCVEAVEASGSGAKITMVVTERGIADPFGKRDPWCVDLPRDAAAYATHAGLCRRDETARPPGSKSTCEELEAAAELWKDYEQWCADMKDEMRGVERVYLHRTKIPHGKQPRHFTGGLELPSDRFGS